MNEEKTKIIAEIEAKQAELNRLCIRKGIYTDIITHHQKTLQRIEKRMAEIHSETEVIKQKVLAWENNKQQEA